MRIPINPAAGSDASRPPIPSQAGHPFRRKPAADSEPSRPPCRRKPAAGPSTPDEDIGRADLIYSVAAATVNFPLLLRSESPFSSIR
jgi:hypothetical protein